MLLALLALAGCVSSPEGPIPIGMVTAYAGFPSVTRNNRTYILAAQSKLYSGDILDTDARSKILVHMIDNSRISLGSGSHLVLNRYKYRKFAASARITFTGGSILVTSGALPTRYLSRFQIQTPLASIGIGESSFWGGFVFGDNILDVTLLGGEKIKVTNQHGSVKIKNQGLGTSVSAGSAPQTPSQWTDRKRRAAHLTTLIE